MPRDINGNFTLDPSNPVVTGTVIDTGWANPTLADIAAALTDSLSRSGSGGMLAPFKFGDGTKAAPGESWINEPTSGWYRPGLHDFRFAMLNNDVLQVTNLAFVSSVGMSAPSVATPIVGPVTDVQLDLRANNAARWSILPSANNYALTPAADNTQDVGAAATRARTGYFGTSVVAPAVNSGADVPLPFQINGVSKWQINASGGAGAFALICSGGDNTFDIGQAGGGRPRSGFFATSVMAPNMGSATLAVLNIMTNLVTRWTFDTGFNFFPAGDLAGDVGAVGARVRTLFAGGVTTGGVTSSGPISGTLLTCDSIAVAQKGLIKEVTTNGVAAATPTQVYTGQISGSMAAVVTGQDAGSNGFVDLIIWKYGGNPITVGQLTTGAPVAARIYTAGGQAILLNVANAMTKVRVIALETNTA